MAIELCSGNLFDSNAQALAHGVNTVGKMGAGIAKQFRVKFPSMFPRYASACRSGLEPGTIFVWSDPRSGRIVYNMATQDRTGPRARMDWVERSFQLVLAHAKENGIQSIAMPRIGCGIGGLEWSQVSERLSSISGLHPTVSVEVWAL